MIQSPRPRVSVPSMKSERSSVEPRGHALRTCTKGRRGGRYAADVGTERTEHGWPAIWFQKGMKGVQRGHQVRAAPTVSAIFAPRAPIGLGAPVVVSRAVWCSISAFSSAPSRITMAEIQSHVMKPIAAPSEP
ncbi:hypothetical protein ACVL91_003422 [Bradyrhizobium elkanii]